MHSPVPSVRRLIDNEMSLDDSHIVAFWFHIARPSTPNVVQVFIFCKCATVHYTFSLQVELKFRG